MINLFTYTSYYLIKFLMCSKGRGKRARSSNPNQLFFLAGWSHPENLLPKFATIAFVMANKNYIFVDESGDPGEPFKTDKTGKHILDENNNKIPTGASRFYIISALPLEINQLHLLEHEILKTKVKFRFRQEIKSNIIPLSLYEAILKLLVKHKIKVYFRCVNKEIYKGTFAVKNKSSKNYFHNVFDTYNTVKVITRGCIEKELLDCEVVIDRADRRARGSPYNFEEFNNYLRKKVNTKTKRRVHFIVHADSEYVLMLQLADLISGAIRDSFTKKNQQLKKIISRNLIKVW